MLCLQKSKSLTNQTYSGQRGTLKDSPNGVVIKAKKGHLMSPQQREVFKSILSKLVREDYGALLLNLKQALQTSIGKGNLLNLTKTSQVKTNCVNKHKFIIIFLLKISIFSLLVEMKDNNKFYKK